LRAVAPPGGVRLTYANAWPFEDRGYNDLPDDEARAAVFDAALARIARMEPDRILIACNTLSILFARTAFSWTSGIPVHGIIDAGVAVFAERLHDDPASSIVLTGTKTTIESGVHRARLEARGVDPARIGTAHCHGLAAAIERDVDGPHAAALIEECAARAFAVAPPGAPLFLGLCCTHYGYVGMRLVDAITRRSGRRVRALDPNLRLVGDLLAGGTFFGGRPPEVGAGGGVTVEVLSKVTLSGTARAGIARLVEPVSPPTAAALLSYALVADLF
jgi:hypothetical protein